MDLPQAGSAGGSGDAGDSKKVFQCGECNRAYSRVDHLTRHVRSHTREKPYRCDICSKGFSRGDLLKRHTAAHQRRYEESRLNGTPGHERISRVSKACKACSEMHLRCDDAKPCERCVKKNIECVTAEGDSDFASPGTSSDGVSAPTPELPVATGPIAQERPVVKQEQYQHQPYQQSGPMYQDGPSPVHQPLPQQPIRASSMHQHPMQTASMPQQHVQTAPMPMPHLQTTSMPQHQMQTTLPIVATQSPYDVSAAGYSTNMQPTMPFFGNEGLGQPVNWFPFTGIQDMTWNDRSLFCFGGYEPAYLMTDVDMAFLNNYNYDIPFDVQLPTPPPPVDHHAESMRHTATLAHDAHRKNAVWRWDPTLRDPGLLKADLRLPPESSRRRIAPLGGRTLEEKLDSRTRDRLVRLVVECCEADGEAHLLPSWEKWHTTFPSVELLDALIQFCLHAPLAGTSLLFHLPTMSIRDARPELVMGLVAMGAIMTPDAALRKLGMALQEVLRQSLLKALEKHNELTRDLQIAQAQHLNLVIGFWSGDGRKTELCEALMYPAITMQRRANRYRRYKYPFPAVLATDEGDELEAKWRAWIQSEQWKRLVHHTSIGDAMNSLLFLAPPLMSYSEVVLPIPDSQQLWSLPTAAEWKYMYISYMPGTSERLPSLHDCMIDITNVPTYGHLLNDRFMIMGIIGNIWRKVWEYRQDSTLYKDKKQRSAALMTKENEVQQLIRNIRFGEDLSKKNNITSLLFLEIVTVHVHMSLDDVQLFTGLEGVEEARRIYPDLVTWSQTPSSRQAIWHAGQVLRIAKNGPKSTLIAISAVAVYQSALAFWTYGLMLRDAVHTQRAATSQYASTYVWLDELENEDKNRFIEHSAGTPVIRGLHDGNNPNSPPPATLDQPARVLDVILHVFRENWNVPGVAMPVLVENLIKLMTGLRAAAEKFVGP